MGQPSKKQDTATGYLVLLVTAESGEAARKIAAGLLERRKAACVNIVPGVSSLFRWQGRVESAEESLLVIKTESSLLSELVALVKQIHSYDVPEIIALPVVGGNPDYLEWIGEAVE